MRALQIEGPHLVREISVPIPQIEPDEALIRVIYSGICATDFEILSGDMSLVRDGSIRYPVRFGHEWVGVIEKIGSAVTDFKPGDRVLCDPIITCGHCPACLEKRFADCDVMNCVGTVNCWDGSFAEYMHIPQRHLHRLPDDMPLMQCALIEPSGIALVGLQKAPNLKGKTILIIGTGAIGMTAVAMARHFEPGKVILAGRTDGKLAIGKKLGADITINVKDEDLIERVQQETGGRGADLVLETSGNISAVNQCVQLARYGGTASFVGFYDHPVDAFPIDALVSREITVAGVMGHFGAPAEVIRILETEKMDLTPIITHVITMDDVPRVMLHPEQLPGDRIKIMVKISPES